MATVILRYLTATVRCLPKKTSVSPGKKRPSCVPLPLPAPKARPRLDERPPADASPQPPRLPAVVRPGGERRFGADSGAFQEGHFLQAWRSRLVGGGRAGGGRGTAVGSRGLRWPRAGRGRADWVVARRVAGRDWGRGRGWSWAGPAAGRGRGRLGGVEDMEEVDRGRGWPRAGVDEVGRGQGWPWTRSAVGVGGRPGPTSWTRSTVGVGDRGRGRPRAGVDTCCGRDWSWTRPAGDEAGRGRLGGGQGRGGS